MLNYEAFLLNKVEFKSLFVLGLFAGFCCNINLMTPASYDEYVFGIGGYWPVKTAFPNPSISYALNGGYKVVISYIIHPNDQISDFSSYG